ncbi:hypothetical protein HDU93_003828 [Gonapodya sp. JEL0774]|nr:hypothetical protein HDU93_003828 [Gonapodya sp. JEL0774]
MSRSEFGTTATGHPMTSGISTSSVSPGTQAKGTAKASGRAFGVGLRLGIIALVVTNVATVAIALSVISYFASNQSNTEAIAQGTSNIMALARARQRDASQAVMTHMETSLSKIYGLTNATVSSVQMGILDVGDFDKLGPHMAINLRAIRPSIRYHMVYSNASQEAAGVGYLFDNATSSEPTNYYFLYIAVNKTCQTYCPVVSTGTRSMNWWLTQTGNGTFLRGGLNSQTAAGLQMWKRPWYPQVHGAALGSVFISDPSTSISAFGTVLVVQFITYPIWDSQNQFVAAGLVVFTPDNLAVILDTLKATSTPNSVYYIINHLGQVLGMTGMSAPNMTTTSPLIVSSGSSYTLKTIWDFPLADYPLVNVSAAAVYESSGRNLDNDVPDAQYSQGDFYFQVVTYKRANYKWIIVSGAPANDYLSDTLILQSKLADRLQVTNRNIIIIAVVIFVVMCVSSALLTEYLILKPMHFMLLAMQKASFVRNKQM